MTKLKIAIELGSDKLKLAFAYEQSGKVVYGKLAKQSILSANIPPAIAYYDEEIKQWIFGDDVYKNTDKPFITVVKIKNLLSLLMRNDNKSIQESNMDFYYHKHIFPKFYFPNRRKFLNNMAHAVECDMTFVADCTPQKVCEDFFRYISHYYINPAVRELEQCKKLVFDVIDYEIIYPPKAGGEYTSELARIVELVFGKKAELIISSTKSLGLYAYHRGVIHYGDNIIIADMGEEDISIAKIALNEQGAILVDGVDGHNEPIDIGGNDIDNCIKKFLEDDIGDRETLGLTKDDGYIPEKGLHSKQFLMMTEIKYAKSALSMPNTEYASIFREGVPISFQREVMIQRYLTREKFLECIGVQNNNLVAKEIMDYLLSELTRSINQNVNKLILSGGLAETYGLVDYIRRQLVLNGFGNIEIYNFDDFQHSNEQFVIQSHEDSVFAPSVGGAICALKGYDISTVLALSYATWLYHDKYAGGQKITEKILSILVKRGEILPKGGEKYSTSTSLSFKNRWGRGAENEEFFSTTAVKSCAIGEPGSAKRKERERDIALRVVSGGLEKGAIKVFYPYKGKLIPVMIRGVLYFNEGVYIDAEGRAVPFVENDVAKNSGRSIEIKLDGNASSNIKIVSASDLLLRFVGIDEFDVEGSD